MAERKTLANWAVNAARSDSTFQETIAYGTKVIGACQNALFPPAGFSSVTWHS